MFLKWLFIEERAHYSEATASQDSLARAVETPARATRVRPLNRSTRADVIEIGVSAAETAFVAVCHSVFPAYFINVSRTVVAVFTTPYFVVLLSVCASFAGVVVRPSVSRGANGGQLVWATVRSRVPAFPFVREHGVFAIKHAPVGEGDARSGADRLEDLWANT